MTFHQIKTVQDVEVHEFGYSPISKPTFTVFNYFLDGLLIDTAMHRCKDRFLKVFESKRIEQVTLTHHHEDHAGNLRAIVQQQKPKQVHLGLETAELLKKKLNLLPYEQYLFGNIEPYNDGFQMLRDEIKTEKYTLTPIYTPGHSIDHHVFLEKKQGWLFSGDLWVGIKIKYFRKGEDFWQQVAALKQVLAFDFEILFCGHHPNFKNGKDLVQEKLDYFEDFGGQVRHHFSNGLNISEIIQKMKLKEQYLARILTQNDVSLRLMIESALKQ